MQQLLNTYIVGMGELSGDTKNQNLIVVFTKADKLVGHFTGKWADLATYLIDGSVDALAETETYLDRMREISDLLHDFTEEELHAHEFINAAESNFKSLSFSIISALGTEPDGAELSVEIVPRRILDPILWVMEKSFDGPLRSLKRWWGW